MLKPIQQKTLALLFLVNALATWAHSPDPGQAVVATVDATKKGPPISPYLYGQFIEHAGSLIYSSLWCEMLDDRKFYYAVQPKPAKDPSAGQRGPSGFGPGRRRNVGPGRWNPIGPADFVVMDTNQPFVGDHTPLISLAGSEPRGIRQTGVNFTEGVTYIGRIQLAGDPGAKVSINIVWGTNTDAVSQTVSLGDLGANYKTFTFSFQAEHSGAAQFEIVGTGTSSFHVGAVSLMPADNLDGWRPDAIAVLKSLRSGVYRWPGGNFVSGRTKTPSINNVTMQKPSTLRFL
jgi:alpha-N-arabinofuranosidase